MNARLGIIGGGQLGLYLCEAAQALGMRVCILAEAADAVALQRADRVIVGDLDSALALDQLLAASDVITFDKEAVPDPAFPYSVREGRPGRVADGHAWHRRGAKGALRRL